MPGKSRGNTKAAAWIGHASEHSYRPNPLVRKNSAFGQVVPIDDLTEAGIKPGPPWCWSCSSGINSDAARSESAGYAGEPVKAEVPAETGATSFLHLPSFTHLLAGIFYLCP